MSDVNKTERNLLVVSYLAEQAMAAPKLFEWLEKNGVDWARATLSDHYQIFSSLEDDDATYAEFMRRIEWLANRPGTRALDVFLHVHGLPGALAFKDGDKRTGEIRQEPHQLGLKGKLRALYSTACYGASHALDFVQGGFRVASGALDVNANAIVEYPFFMDAWRDEKGFRPAIQRTPQSITAIQDSIARTLGFGDADSTKQIEGRPLTRITSLAD
jgi:hypothetical protein